MTLYRYNKDEKLYLIYKELGFYLGPTYTAIPYKHQSKILREIKLKNFTAVADLSSIA